MGNLQEYCVTPNASFNYSGIDFVGPFTVHEFGRDSKPFMFIFAFV